MLAAYWCSEQNAAGQQRTFRCFTGKLLRLQPVSHCAQEPDRLPSVGRYCQDLSSEPMLRQPPPGQYRDSACVLPIGSCLLILLGEAIGFLLLAVYCDNVLPDENGMRQPLWCVPGCVV